MPVVAEIQRWAAIVPDYVVTAVVLSLAATATLISGLARGRAAMRLWLPGVAFVTLSAVAMWPLSTGRPGWWLRYVVLGLAGVALLAHPVTDERRQEESVGESGATTRSSRLWLAAVLVAAGVFLFYNLSGYSGDALMTWEATVTLRFGEAVAAGQSVLRFVLERLLWDDGVLSAGNTSLFYGAPTYALFHTIGISPWTLRCAAVVATLLSVMVAFAIGKHFFGPLVGAAMAVLFALNPSVLFYGRYGSSPAGTLLAVLLALLTTWLFLESEQSAWWHAAVCATALYLATLQYSPGRIAVVILLAFIPLGLVYQWRQVGWRRLAGLAVIGVMAAGVWGLERSFQRQGSFLQARGETFFALLRSPAYINSLYGGVAPLRIRPGALSLHNKIELLGRALKITVPQYLKSMLPVLAPAARGEVITSDPPPLQLYYGPAVVFLLWGAVHSLRRWRSWPRACLLLWVAFGTAPMLLTNRVDAHRMMLFVIPLSFLAALGIREAAGVMERASVPRVLQSTTAAALALSAAYSAVNVLECERLPGSAASRAIAVEAAGVRGPVVLGVDGMQRDLGFVYLRLLERWRRDPARAVKLLDNSIIHGVESALGEPPEPYVHQLERLSTTATILLAPAYNFRRVAVALARKGVRVVERGTPQSRLLRLGGSGEAVGVGREESEILPIDVLRPSPVPPPIHLREGPKRLLTDLEPTAVTFGFAPPKVDRNWNGEPIRMGGVTYEHGLGTHAWCRLTYAVPSGATAFQAIVGLSDGVRECEKAAVTFEIHADNDKLLYDSGLVNATTPPQAVYVKLGDSHTITLVVTEGGNGPDCDHALWALPAFLMSK